MNEGETGAGGNSVDCQAVELGLGRRNTGFLLGVVGVRVGAAEGVVGLNDLAAGVVGSAVAFVLFRVFGASGTGGVASSVSSVTFTTESGL